MKIDSVHHSDVITKIRCIHVIPFFQVFFLRKRHLSKCMMTRHTIVEMWPAVVGIMMLSLY